MTENQVQINNKAMIYKTQQAMTASPQELAMMLYNGALRFIAESIKAIEDKDMEKAHEANIRAQDIVRELMNSLDMENEVAKGLYQLYDYLDFRLVQANMKKDPVQLEEAKEMLTELRDTWFQAMKMAREQEVFQVGVAKIV